MAKVELKAPVSSKSNYYAKHKPYKVNKKCPVPSLTEPKPLSFVSYMLPLPATAAHSGRVIATQAVLSVEKAAGKTRCGQVAIDTLHVCKSAVTMLKATRPTTVFFFFFSL